MTTTLRGCARPLAEEFDVGLLDLDGVVYLGHQAVTGAPEALADARERGMRIVFVTNNAARPPSVVAEHLRDLGVPAEPDEVVTSAQAAAHHLAERLEPGAHVLVVGTVGLDEALRERGLLPVYRADEEPAAVVQGYSSDIGWAELAEGAVAILRGVPWVATNLDPTVPSPRGPLPGNGSLVAALRHATGATPIATGKPDPTMHRETVQRANAQRPLVVGDRLDTDIEGANAVGCASLLVLTGVTTPAVLLAARPELRPSFVARDLGGLLHGHEKPVFSGGSATCGTWRATAVLDSLTLAEVGNSRTETHDDPVALDALRALCAAAWSAADEAADEHDGAPAEAGRGTGAREVAPAGPAAAPRVQAQDARATSVLKQLDLT